MNSMPHRPILIDTGTWQGFNPTDVTHDPAWWTLQLARLGRHAGGLGFDTLVIGIPATRSNSDILQGHRGSWYPYQLELLPDDLFSWFVDPRGLRMAMSQWGWKHAWAFTGLEVIRDFTHRTAGRYDLPLRNARPEAWMQHAHAPDPRDPLDRYLRREQLGSWREAGFSRVYLDALSRTYHGLDRGTYARLTAEVCDLDIGTEALLLDKDERGVYRLDPKNVDIPQFATRNYLEGRWLKSDALAWRLPPSANVALVNGPVRKSDAMDVEWFRARSAQGFTPVAWQSVRWVWEVPADELWPDSKRPGIRGRR